MVRKDIGWVFGSQRPTRTGQTEVPVPSVPGSLKSLSTHQLGVLGEEAACRYVLDQGYEIIDRNWHSPFGEADIVAVDDETVVLLEVKARINDGRAEELLPELAVTEEKRERYARIASYFMSIHPELSSIRFDVASVELVEQGEPLVRYLYNAYEWDD